jgi:hypothetical protein
MSSPKYSTTSVKTQKYNDLTHEMELFLDNSGNFEGIEGSKYHINPASVLNLTITDTYNTWVAEGSLTFLYMPDDVPVDVAGQSSPTATKGALDNGSLLKSYQIRGDGFDLLRVRISPKIDPKEASSGSPLNINNEDPKWWLSYLFSVYDIEDISEVPQTLGPAAFYMKCVKMHFKDVRRQILKTTNLEYSTSYSSQYAPNFNSGLATEGALKTGEAILDILNNVIGSPEMGGSEEFLQPKEDPVNWDPGANYLFYTSPANFSALDDIDYLYSHHISSKPLKNSNVRDLSIMHTRRADVAGYIEPLTITPVSDLFEKSGSEIDKPGELQLEHFFVTSAAQEKSPETKDPTKLFKAPISDSKDSGTDLKTSKYGQILTYSFVDMAPQINSEMFTTLPVYSVDIGTRKFRVEFKQNTVANAKKLLAENYIEKLYKGSSSKLEDLFLPSIHKTKKDRNIFPLYTLNGDNDPEGNGALTRQKNGIDQLLYTGLFQNACICFKTLGLTLRQSGTFIGIDKVDGCLDSDYNNKLYGQWFVVKVDHAFEEGTYINIIYAIKIHRHDPREQQFDNLLEDEIQ